MENYTRIRKKIATDEERARRIWRYYDLTRLVLLILLVAGLYYLCEQ